MRPHESAKILKFTVFPTLLNQISKHPHAWRRSPASALGSGPQIAVQDPDMPALKRQIHTFHHVAQLATNGAALVPTATHKKKLPVLEVIHTKEHEGNQFLFALRNRATMACHLCWPRTTSTRFCPRPTPISPDTCQQKVGRWGNHAIYFFQYCLEVHLGCFCWARSLYR